MSDELNMSSVTADPAPETAGKRAAPEEKTPGKRAGLIIGIAAAVLVLAYAGCCVAANALYSHTAFPNTSVLGMDMSEKMGFEIRKGWKSFKDFLGSIVDAVVKIKNAVSRTMSY